MADLSTAVLQIKGILVAWSLIATRMGTALPDFEAQLHYILQHVKSGQVSELRPLVDRLMELGLRSPAHDIFRKIGRQSRATIATEGTRSLRSDGVFVEASTDPLISVEQLRHASQELLDELTRWSLTHQIQPPAPLPQEPMPEEPARYVNFTFTDVTREWAPRELPVYEGFVSDCRYRLTVGIGLTPDVRFHGRGSQPPMEYPAAGETVDLYVVAMTRAPSPLTIVNQLVDLLKWPATGPSTRNANFFIEVAPTNVPCSAMLDIYIYHQTRLLYTASLTITIQPRGTVWTPGECPILWVNQTDDTHRSQLFHRFASLKEQPPRGLNLAIQAGATMDEYLLTAFLGRAEFPVRVTMSAEELNSHLVRMRRLLDDLRRERVYIEGGYTAQGHYVGEYLGQQGTYTQVRELIPAQSARDVFTTFMKQMAYLGSQFYDDLLRSDSGQLLRQAIEAHLQEGDIIQIWIDKDASNFVYPWTWLYGETIDPSHRYQVKPNLFWGYRYIVEQLPQFRETMGKEPPANVVPCDPLMVKIGVWNFEPTTEAQKQYFDQCSQDSNGSLHYEIWDDDGSWEHFLPQCNSQILYFFSHGHTAKPTTLPEQQFYDMLARWKAWVVQPLPAESAWMQQYRQRAIDLLKELEANANLLSETYIRLQYGYLLLRELRKVMKLDQSAPLVFLNMCESAQVFPDISESLIDVFLKKGARGVIGTEIPMLDSFADLFSRRLFDALFYVERQDGTPVSVGQGLLDLRRHFLDAGNPLGFAYTLFGDATTRLRHALPRKNERSTAYG